jgi:ATP-binding protein involved in chromosome partitioning
MKKLFNFPSLIQSVTLNQVLAELSQVMDPELNRDLVSLGMVKDVTVRGRRVSFTIHMREAGSPLQVPIERRARRAVLGIPGVRDVDIQFEARSAAQSRQQLRDTTRFNLDARHVVAVASSKGGVGKSTLSVNLAVALAQNGHRVGLLDGDIHGPNVPQMLGILDERPIAFGERIFPPNVHGIAVMSMGFLVPGEAPVIWRGPMLHQALRQMLRDVMWGSLDFLIVDLPPGTGDVQLTLSQTLPLTGAVLVTTPQEVALADVIRGGEMFRQLEVPVLGLVENMSYYVCPHCGQTESIFGEGGGERLSQRLGAPLLAQVPLDPAVRSGGDAGEPVVLAAPGSPAGNAFHKAARALLEQVSAVQASRPAQPQFIPDPDLPIL